MIIQKFIDYFRKRKNFFKYTLTTGDGIVYTGISNNPSLTPIEFMKKFAKEEYKKWKKSGITDDSIYWENFNKINSTDNK